MTRITLDSSWINYPTIKVKHDSYTQKLSAKQLKLLTPVFINSTTLEILKDAYLQLFRKSGTIYTPNAFRYSYSFKVKGKNIMATTLYHLEKDFNLMKDRYGILVHLETLKLTGASWEAVAYSELNWFDLDCEKAQHKLIKTKSEETYLGWFFKELFPDREVK